VEVPRVNGSEPSADRGQRYAGRATQSPELATYLAPSVRLSVKIDDVDTQNRVVVVAERECRGAPGRIKEPRAEHDPEPQPIERPGERREVHGEPRPPIMIWCSSSRRPAPRVTEGGSGFPNLLRLAPEPPVPLIASIAQWPSAHRDRVPVRQEGEVSGAARDHGGNGVSDQASGQISRSGGRLDVSPVTRMTQEKLRRSSKG